MEETLKNKETAQLGIGAVSSRYLSAEKAKQMTIEAQKEIAAKEYDTKYVLEQIEEATQNGSFETQTYDDDKIRQNLVLLGYKCSDPFKIRDDVYMKVTWL
jgi:hypothetical protein